MRAILDVILLALQIYVWLLIAAAVLSWLIAFNVVNTRNQFVSTVGEFLYRITEPALRPIAGHERGFAQIQRAAECREELPCGRDRESGDAERPRELSEPGIAELCREGAPEDPLLVRLDDP